VQPREVIRIRLITVLTVGTGTVCEVVPWDGVRCRDVVSVLNVSVSRRSRDVFWNVSSRLGLEG